ncbi:hypothetical protein, partial [Phyllobacterium salinisoli]|uniref:hypothetical protein n=1 Tax=Phyllobacterium salinisoli TaxID=1899321 RepID=UPI001AECFC0D
PTAAAITALVASKRKPIDMINPFTADAAGGLMGDICRWILDTLPVSNHCWDIDAFAVLWRPVREEPFRRLRRAHGFHRAE